MLITNSSAFGSSKKQQLSIESTIKMEQVEVTVIQKSSSVN